MGPFSLVGRCADEHGVTERVVAVISVCVHPTQPSPVLAALLAESEAAARRLRLAAGQGGQELLLPVPHQAEEGSSVAGPEAILSHPYFSSNVQHPCISIRQASSYRMSVWKSGINK